MGEGAATNMPNHRAPETTINSTGSVPSHAVYSIYNVYGLEEMGEGAATNRPNHRGSRKPSTSPFGTMSSTGRARFFKPISSIFQTKIFDFSNKNLRLFKQKSSIFQKKI
jgi:hypothetical protein